MLRFQPMVTSDKFELFLTALIFFVNFVRFPSQWFSLLNLHDLDYQDGQ